MVFPFGNGNMREVLGAEKWRKEDKSVVWQSRFLIPKPRVCLDRQRWGTGNAAY